MAATVGDLNCLLNPVSIAIVGASDNPDKIGGRPIHYMRKHGYGGRLYPVNPTREVVQGERTWPSLGDLPEVPDLAIIAVAGKKAIEAVDACSQLGVRAAIVIAAGFSEIGPAGKVLQDDMTRRARATGMRIVGPNSQGLANFGNGAIASFSTMFLEVEPADGPVAVISQSGGMSAMIYGLLRQRDIGVRHVHATGNEADVTVAELAVAVLADPDVRIVLMYLESLQNAGDLAAAAALAKARGVPLVVVKAGRSPAGLKAAASHTGALANEDRVVEAFFEHHGILRARDPQELARYAELIIQSAPSHGRRVVVVSNSGASCVLASDAADVHGLEIAPLEENTKAQLATFLSDFATTDNPVDITAALLSNNRLFGDVLSVIGNDPAADMFVVDIPVAGRGYDVASFAQDTAAFARAAEKPVALVAWQEPVARAFRARGLPVYDDEQQAMSALAALARLQEITKRPAVVWPESTAAELPSSTSTILSEADSLELLGRQGIGVVRHELCRDADAAVSAWRQFGVPVAVKACSAQLPHKSEYGLVGLGLNSETSIRDAVAEQASMLKRLGVDQEGWVVAPMQRGLHEMAVGMNLDPVFGPVILVGAGGKYVEAMPDVAVLIPPFSKQDVLEKLKGLRIWPLLEGVRGDPPSDVDALAQLAVRLGQFSLETASRVQSIDINPVCLAEAGKGAVAVDALVQLAEAEPRL